MGFGICEKICGFRCIWVVFWVFTHEWGFKGFWCTWGVLWVLEYVGFFVVWRWLLCYGGISPLFDHLCLKTFNGLLYLPIRYDQVGWQLLVWHWCSSGHFWIKRPFQAFCHWCIQVWKCCLLYQSQVKKFTFCHLSPLSAFIWISSLSPSLPGSLLLPFLFDRFWRSKASSPKSLAALSDKGAKQAHTCHITKLWAVVVLQIWSTIKCWWKAWIVS